MSACPLPLNLHDFDHSFLEPDDPNLAYNLIGHRGDFPEPAENPERPNIMSSVTKLIKEGSLTKFISAGQFPAVMSEPFTEHHRRAQMAEYFGVLDKVNVQVIPTLDP